MSRVISYDFNGIMSRAMEYSMLRHEILADNIANIDTPGFKRSDVSFQFELQRALGAQEERGLELQRSSPRHFAGSNTSDPAQVKAKVFIQPDTWTRNDLNNVDPEAEMANMAQNVMYYQALSNRLSARFRQLNSIMTKNTGM